MDYWFTSDTHFGHANIIRYSKRPQLRVGDTRINSIGEEEWVNYNIASERTVEMNEFLIKKWNEVVKPNDLVYHLGDFCFGREDSIFDIFFRRLNGLIVFIEGNHDRLARRNRRKFYGYHEDGKHEIEVNGKDITLCHYAMRVWNKSHRGAWHLYGHSHGSLPDDPNSKSFDCGVDCMNYRPVNFEEVSQIMAKKIYVPVDHHKPNHVDTTDVLP